MKDVAMEDGRLRLRLWLRMLRATRAVEAELRERLREEFGQTLPHFDALAALHRRPGGVRMGELGRMLMVSGGNVTALIDRLVEDGLAERFEVKGDRRATAVRLTRKGRRRFEKMAPAHHAWIEELTAGVAAREARAMLAPLERMARKGESE